MRLVLAVVVGTNQGANHQHRCASRAHEAGQHHANEQQAAVELGATVQIATDVNATRDGVQGSQQNNERNVFSQHGVYEVDTGCINPKKVGKRQEKRDRPGGRNLAEMVVPKAVELQQRCFCCCDRS